MGRRLEEPWGWRTAEFRISVQVRYNRLQAFHLTLLGWAHYTAHDQLIPSGPLYWRSPAAQGCTCTRIWIWLLRVSSAFSVIGVRCRPRAKRIWCSRLMHIIVVECTESEKFKKEADSEECSDWLCCAESEHFLDEFCIQPRGTTTAIHHRTRTR